MTGKYSTYNGSPNHRSNPLHTQLAWAHKTHEKGLEHNGQQPTYPLTPQSATNEHNYALNINLQFREQDSYLVLNRKNRSAQGGNS
jgi:hypothetical protein